MIKSWDYSNEYRDLRKDILKAVDRVFKSGKLFFGNELIKFEKNFLKQNKCKFGIGVGSGTDALYVALKALNIGYNDEVITVANTAIPTVAAIRNTGATVIFVDIGEDYLIDVKKIEKSITKKTKAIIPVHLYGQSCDMEKIIKISKKYKLKIIEDCAQAQGATFKKKNVGTFGHFGCFSFYPTKILGAYGDGGFITTNNKNLFQKARRIRFYGIEELNKNKWWNKKYYAFENGTNSRLTEVQAAILNVKLKKVNRWIKRRRKIASIYNKKLSKFNITIPKENGSRHHVYHLYVVAHKKRELILKKMKQNGIVLGIHYEYPLHKMKAYKNSFYLKHDNLINTEKFSKKIFSLPIYPTLENSKINKIISIFNKFFNDKNN